MKKRSRGPVPHGGGERRSQAAPAPVARTLAPAELRWRCEPRSLQAAVRSAEADTEPPSGRRAPRLPVSVDELVGQERALAAIRTGLLQDGPGFNIFVCGWPGTGRESLVRAALREAFEARATGGSTAVRSAKRFQWAGFRPPRDRLYVADFDRPDRPRLVTLPRGRGKKFKREVDELILVLRNALVTAFEDEEFRDRREHLKRGADRRARRLFSEFSDRIHDEDFSMGPVGDGFATPELMLELRSVEKGGRRWLTRKQVEKRVERGDIARTRSLAKKLARMTEVERELEAVAARAREVARRGSSALKKLDERTARLAALGPVRDLAERYPTQAVRVWTDQLIERIGERLHVFLERHPDEPEPDERDHPDDRRDRPQGDSLAEYRANLVVDASARPVPPVIFEEVPTYSNLMGTLEAGDPQGPEHLRIRAGSLLAADGGVLVLDARELLQDNAAWRALKKALLRGRVEVQRFEPQSHQPAGPVRPSGVKIALKVVLVGDDESFHQLHDHDDDFRSVFKVKVEVDDSVLNTEATRLALATTLARLARRAGLLAPDASALARLVEHAARLAGRRDRLALRLGELLDVLREAEEHVQTARRIKAEHVHSALLARRARHDLSERKTQELLDEGVVLVDTSGSRMGQVNALAVYDTGDHVFARPSRVTASVSVGRAGVIDIEREAHLSGDTHHKGIQIMAGFLRSRWSQDKPLCLTASVCFEQSYSPIDGDSASVAEVVAILSALAGVPLDQSWAVTGSLNQMGDVQAIGDVNEKVEGFFDACRARGLTGAQGVLVPASNLGDLMLRHDVLEAVEAGRFHVRATRTIDDVLEVLAKVSAASVHERVRAKLGELAEAWRSYERGGSPS